MRPRSTIPRRGTTLPETAVVIAVVVTLLACVVPAAAWLRGSSGQEQSMANLQTLSAAHAMYAWTWDDRQVTWVPDDFGVFGGDCLEYIQVECPPQLFLGWDQEDNPAMWGYFLGNEGECDWNGTTCTVMPAYFPLDFELELDLFGSFRLPNAKAFHDTVGGRFYDGVFYAPNDTLTIKGASAYFDVPAEFSFSTGEIIRSSYCLSPSAMWHPDVLSLNRETGQWFNDPNTFDEGYQSPTVSQAMYPELKTRMIEHNWNLGAPGIENPLTPGFPYFFNAGLDAAPLTLFFDGHVTVLPNAQVAADDEQVLESTGGAVGLWTRDTPFGADGYFGAQSPDGFRLSHHILTADGILGRDVLQATPSGDVRSGRLPTPTRHRAVWQPEVQGPEAWTP